MITSDLIPLEKREAVVRALQDAFGVSEFEDISLIKHGITRAFVFRIVVKGSPYLLRIVMRNDDATRHYACMRAAADAGIAPRVWHTNAEERISITDFVDAKRLCASEALAQMSAILRRVHRLAPISEAVPHLNTTCTFLLNRTPFGDGFLEKFKSAALVPDCERDEAFARFAQIVEAYRKDDADMVTSHNDLFKPHNVLFDGTRVWLVDWEAAFRNDRYADLAAVANLVVMNEADEEMFLSAYFGQPPDPYQSARFFLMRTLAHFFYGVAFLSLGAAGKAIDRGAPALSYEEFHQRVWTGEIDLEDNDIRSAYGKAHWARLLQCVGLSRFDESLSIVRNAASARSSAP